MAPCPFLYSIVALKALEAFLVCFYGDINEDLTSGSSVEKMSDLFLLIAVAYFPGLPIDLAAIKLSAA